MQVNMAWNLICYLIYNVTTKLIIIKLITSDHKLILKREIVNSFIQIGKYLTRPLLYVTLHGKTGIKVKACSQHANTARLVCPKTRLMRIFNF